MPISELLTVTVTQAVALVVAVVIPGVVAYALGLMQLDERAKAIANYVLVAVLTTLVTSLASFVPDQIGTMKLVDALVLVVTTWLGGFGAISFGMMKADEHFLQAFQSKMRRAALAAK